MASCLLTRNLLSSNRIQTCHSHKLVVLLGVLLKIRDRLWRICRRLLSNTEARVLQLLLQKVLVVSLFLLLVSLVVPLVLLGVHCWLTQRCQLLQGLIVVTAVQAIFSEVLSLWLQRLELVIRCGIRKHCVTCKRWIVQHPSRRWLHIYYARAALNLLRTLPVDRLLRDYLAAARLRLAQNKLLNLHVLNRYFNLFWLYYVMFHI